MIGYVLRWRSPVVRYVLWCEGLRWTDGYMVGLHTRVFASYCIFCASVSLHHGPFVASYRTLYCGSFLNTKIHVSEMCLTCAVRTRPKYYQRISCVFDHFSIFISAVRVEASTFSTPFTKLTSIILSYPHTRTTYIVYSPTSLIVSSMFLCYWCVCTLNW